VREEEKRENAAAGYTRSIYVEYCKRKRYAARYIHIYIYVYVTYEINQLRETESQFHDNSIGIIGYRSDQPIVI